MSRPAASADRRLLIVHHTSSPSLEAMLEAVLEGTRAEGLESVPVLARAALAATAYDVLHADAYLLGTPANIGYMSGALKHFFDQVYYPCRKERVGSPYAVYVHGNLDVTGALRAVHAIATGMGWQQAAADVVVHGAPTKADLEACWNLGATLAAGLLAAG